MIWFLDFKRMVCYGRGKGPSMLPTAVIAFREFFEAFLIIGIFLGVSRKLVLNKEKEIALAAGLGILLSFILAIATYLLAADAHTLLTEKNADSLESYLLIFSGVFIGYVVLSLHKSIGKQSKQLVQKAHQKMEQEIFDTSLFLIIVFMIIREGFEIALFTAGTSLFSAFMQNLIGLFVGFLFSSVLGILVYFAYVKFSIGKIFKITEYIIILLGASMIQVGFTKLFATHFAINLASILPLPLSFLPNEDSMIGSLLQSFFGVDRNFSILRLSIMAVYIVIVYLFYMRQKSKPKFDSKNVQ